MDFFNKKFHKNLIPEIAHSKSAILKWVENNEYRGYSN